MTRATTSDDIAKVLALMSLTEQENKIQCIADLAMSNIVSRECSDEIETESVGEGVDRIIIKVNPTTELWTALAKSFDFFNEELFGSELDASKVMLNASRRSRAAGFYRPRSWTGEGNRKEGGIDEISINPDHMGHKTPRRILSTLVHEMAHMWQEHFGKPSKKGYHNKEWANKMEEVGLMPSDTWGPGGKKTGPKVSHYVIEGGVFDEAFKKMPKELQLPFVGLNIKGPKKKVGYHKFVCVEENCRQVVRAKESAKIACVPCSLAKNTLVHMQCRGQ
jgi:hypothetical protein